MNIGQSINQKINLGLISVRESLLSLVWNSILGSIWNLVQISIWDLVWDLIWGQIFELIEWETIYGNR